MNQHDPEAMPAQGDPSGGGPGAPAQGGSQWAGPTAGGAAAPGTAGYPIPVQPTPVLFRPEPKRRGGPSGFAVVFTLAALLCIGGVAFAAGRLTAPAAAAATTNTGGFGGNGRFPNASPGAGFGGNGGFGAALAGGLSIQGTVTAVAADGTLTLTLANGTTLDVATNGQTTYHNESAGTAASVVAGKTVRVQVSRAAFGGGFGNGGPGGPAASIAPGASAGPTTQTATDILIVTP